MLWKRRTTGAADAFFPRIRCPIFHPFLSCRKFVFFSVPQIQYRNPWLQIMLLKNMTPSPFLRFYLVYTAYASGGPG
ncbi:unnamed protein product [Ranitomeya imitator]|uniref:Small ribosomal subunit protein mS25 n=1 Tax=Ranitomeya imitator TaxID=111125 RepID=A0ABN9LKF9_9NEOB|nr:unnamed protein product [Ranitomeya imitator]